MEHPLTTFLAVLLQTMLVTNPANAASEPQTKPNNIIILADDLGPGDMSCAGATKLKNTNIVRLASEGFRFTNGYTRKIAPDSIDVSDLILGKSEQNIRTHTVLHGVGGLALRDGDWKHIPATTLTGGIGSGANAADERFSAANIPEPLLFNLATDPNEKTNVHSQFPEKAKELSEKLGVCETHVIK